MKSTLSGDPTVKTTGGKSYWVQNFYDATGKRKQTSGATSSAARKAAMLKIEDGTEISGEDCRFDAFATRFIKVSRVGGRDGKETLDHDTLRAYVGYLKNWINPHLGHLMLSKITTGHMRDFLEHLLENVENRGTVKSILTITKVILGYAKTCEIIKRVPGVDLKVVIDWSKKESLKKSRIPTVDEMNRLDAAARAAYFSNEYNLSKAYKRYYPLYLLLRSTGMRFSECIGLQWGDFDEKMETVTVSRRVSPPGQGKTEATRSKRPKSKNGLREIPVPPNVKTILLKWKQECKSDWLFATRTGNPMNYHNVRDKFWVPLLKRAEVEGHGMHSLRHYYASTLINNGVYKELSSYLGHHSSTFTMDAYGHLLKDNGETNRRIGNMVGDSISM